MGTPYTFYTFGAGVLLSTRICMMPDLSLFIAIPFSKDQFSTVCSVLPSARLPSMYMTRSSAKARHLRPLVLSNFTKSSIKRTNSIGLRRLPYGTPIVLLMNTSWCSSDTLRCVCLKSPASAFTISKSMPIFLSLWISFSLSTLSNAF